MAINCPSCGRVNEPGATFCTACGYYLAGTQASGEEFNAAWRPAGFWIRLVSMIIDLVIIAVVEGVLISLWPGLSLGEYYADRGWAGLVSFAAQAAYYTIGVAVWAMTIGKKPFGLQVLRPDGSKCGVGRALARFLCYIPSALLLFAGFWMVAFRRDKRALHDLICDTVVVRPR